MSVRVFPLLLIVYINIVIAVEANAFLDICIECLFCSLGFQECRLQRDGKN